MSTMRATLVRELQELISALDRRVPQVERAGEVSIARDAAALKLKALNRLAELEGSGRPQSIGLDVRAEEDDCGMKGC